MPCPCRTSADSMALCVAHLQNDLKQKPALIRKKADVAMVEEVSLKAALCHNTGPRVVADNASAAAEACRSLARQLQTRPRACRLGASRPLDGPVTELEPANGHRHVSQTCRGHAVHSSRPQCSRNGGHIGPGQVRTFERSSLNTTSLSTPFGVARWRT